MNLRALGIPAIIAIVAIAGRETGSGTAMSALQSSNCLGNIIGALAAGILLDFFGYKTVFYLSGIIMIISVALCNILKTPLRWNYLHYTFVKNCHDSVFFCIVKKK